MLNKSLTAVWVLVASITAHSRVDPIQEIFEPAPPSPIHRFDKVAVVQWAPDTNTPLGVSHEVAEAYKMENRKILERYIRQAADQGAKLVVTPEFGIVGYPDVPELPPEEDCFRNFDDARPYVEAVPGPTTHFFGALARELGIYIHVGFMEGDPTTNNFYNVAVALNPSGEIVAKYHKINLYHLENEFLKAGSSLSTYQSPWGKIGIIICADVYSSFPMEDYQKANTKILALSTSWAQWNTGMSYFKEAAIRYNVTVLAANQTYFPDSGVISAGGKIQSHIRQSTGIAYGYLEKKAKCSL